MGPLLFSFFCGGCSWGLVGGSVVFSVIFPAGELYFELSGAGGLRPTVLFTVSFYSLGGSELSCLPTEAGIKALVSPGLSSVSGFVVTSVTFLVTSRFANNTGLFLDGSDSFLYVSVASKRGIVKEVSSGGFSKLSSVSGLGSLDALSE